MFIQFLVKPKRVQQKVKNCRPMPIKNAYDNMK